MKISVAVALAISTGAAFAVDRPVGLGEPITVDGIRVTLLAALNLTAAERETRHGAAVGGRRLVWLVEPRERQTDMPIWGEVRLTFGGAQYNAVTNAASSKPFAPDLILHDYSTFLAKHPTWLGPKKLSPRRNAIIAEVLIRGAAHEPDETGTAEIELGILPQDAQPSPHAKPRYVWFRVNLERRK